MRFSVRSSFNIIFSILLFVLLVAIGTEVVALHRGGRLAGSAPAVPPVVVRKSVSAPMPPKTVRRVPTSIPHTALWPHPAACRR